jgi:hypothetical protein
MRNSCASEGWPGGISKMIPTPVLLRLDRSLLKEDAMLREAWRAFDILDRLEQAVLGKAFCGELVEPQPTVETKMVISQ